jgi:hypothetical protein
MTHDSALDPDWHGIVDRLGGAEALTRSARETGAFRRAREIRSAMDLLRLLLAYCLGDRGLRSVAAWATAIGLADISSVAILYRLRHACDWLAYLVGCALAGGMPKAGQGRLIRLIDATTVAKAGCEAKRKNRLWRVHSAFELPSERFGAFEVTDERGGEQIDRIPVVKGEIRVGDRAHLQPDRIARVMDEGGDVLVRAPWRNARWLDEKGEPLDLPSMFLASEGGLIDQPIWIGRKSGPPLALRLVAVRKSEKAAAEARRKARLQARKEGYQLSMASLAAADWVILVTSLKSKDFPTDDILALYRLRWRIELAFKRLKSIVGLKGPPGSDPFSARAYVLAHLLMILLLEPLHDAFEDSPRWPADA